ncbi:hypothetical protein YASMINEVIRUS_1002 [Yasminevirus sp. GU-2018]|uniref:Uncharacterized protein n=1 Tax=Yasminevirus sp. GU-2018 TaxID=2420051 RepID=A0A5K0U8R0_9VIRU|nr:hypothetical protein YASMINEVIRUS_1002 [Yasminevirus sp. GU-2018]
MSTLADSDTKTQLVSSPNLPLNQVDQEPKEPQPHTQSNLGSELFDDVWEIDDRGSNKKSPDSDPSYSGSLIKTTSSTAGSKNSGSRTGDDWDEVLGLYEPSRKTNETKQEQKPKVVSNLSSSVSSQSAPAKKKKGKNNKPTVNLTGKKGSVNATGSQSKSMTGSNKNSSYGQMDDDNNYDDDYDDTYDDYYD